MADKIAKKQTSRFKPGQSGNPAGRPSGARNSTTVALESMFDGQAEAICGKAIDLALTGDPTMIRLCMDRLLPPRKDRPVTFVLPPVTQPWDASNAMAGLLKAVADGDITPIEAGEVTKLIDSFVRTIEASDHAERIARLERAQETDT